MSVEGLAVVITALSGLISGLGLVLTNRSQQVKKARKSDRKLLARYEQRDQKALMHIRALELKLIECGETPRARPSELGPDWLFADDEDDDEGKKAVTAR
jgi:hypothetical protein